MNTPIHPHDQQPPVGAGESGNLKTSNVRPPRFKHWPSGRALLCGLGFEVTLLVILFGRFNSGWPVVQLYDLALWSHYPLLLIADYDGDLLQTLFPLYEVLLILLWAFAFDRLRKGVRWLLVRYGVSKSAKSILVAGAVSLGFGVIAFATLDSCFDRPIPYAP
jgi:hypothetical protein